MDITNAITSPTNIANSKNKDTIVVASSIGFTDTCTLKTQYLSKLLIYNSLTILSAEFMIIIILPH
ncbi:MAG: hypothetical protein ACLTNL_07110 [Clostridium sp.]|uniref:hypothetical protein n=1 Tax=uncultured Clostridium sp. TaxID=59620 RepID=UPI00280A71C6|nr:hypothetical protein [uncultured Clostridium sp.]